MSDAPILRRMRGALAAVWEKSSSRIFERVALLEWAAMALLEGTLAEEQRRAAEIAAHQLAGTCGTFGFAQATDLAREAERALAGHDPVPPHAVFRLAEIAVLLRDQLAAGIPDPGDPAFGAAPDAAVPPPAAEQGEDAEIILALDDDPHALEIIGALLSPAGYRLLGTTDPHIFLELLAAQPPAMVILDVDMPVVTGLEMCRRLRADPRWVTLPVLFLTARSDAESVARMFDAGADDYTAKPVVGPELIARIRNRLARSRLPRAVAPAPSVTTDVVLVEDDRVLAGLLEQSLATAGLTTTTFRDGPSALDALTAADGNPAVVRPRVIVLDVGLPGMDGLTVLRALARQGVTRRARVVMLTARTSESETVQALELGAFDHVAKPFSVPILLQRIRRAIDPAGTSQ